MLSPDTCPVDQGFSRSAVDGDGAGFAVLGVDGIEGDLADCPNQIRISRW